MNTTYLPDFISRLCDFILDSLEMGKSRDEIIFFRPPFRKECLFLQKEKK